MHRLDLLVLVLVEARRALVCVHEHRRGARGCEHLGEAAGHGGRALAGRRRRDRHRGDVPADLHCGELELGPQPLQRLRVPLGIDLHDPDARKPQIVRLPDPAVEPCEQEHEQDSRGEAGEEARAGRSGARQACLLGAYLRDSGLGDALRKQLRRDRQPVDVRSDVLRPGDRRVVRRDAARAGRERLRLTLHQHPRRVQRACLLRAPPVDEGCGVRVDDVHRPAGVARAERDADVGGGERADDEAVEQLEGGQARRVNLPNGRVRSIRVEEAVGAHVADVPRQHRRRDRLAP